MKVELFAAAYHEEGKEDFPLLTDEEYVKEFSEVLREAAEKIGLTLYATVQEEVADRFDAPGEYKRIRITVERVDE